MSKTVEIKQEGAESMVGLEIERKFLLREYPRGIEQFPFSKVRQGYVVSGNGFPTVRVRRELTSERKTRWYETIKSNKRDSGIVRDEVTIPITQGQFEALWEMTEGRRVYKRRYFVPLEHFTGEESPYIAHLDIYTGRLKGLLTAEIEFLTLLAARIFIPPQAFGSDVTRTGQYSNSRLAVNGMPAGSPLFFP